MTFSTALFPTLFLCCYFLCNLGFILPALFLLLFSSLFFYTVLYRSLATEMAWWPFQTPACSLPPASLWSVMLLGTEHTEIRVCYEWGSAHGRTFDFWESSAIPLLRCATGLMQGWDVKRKTKLSTAGITNAVVLASGFSPASRSKAVCTCVPSPLCFCVPGSAVLHTLRISRQPMRCRNTDSFRLFGKNYLHWLWTSGFVLRFKLSNLVKSVYGFVCWVSMCWSQAFSNHKEVKFQ